MQFKRLIIQQDRHHTSLTRSLLAINVGVWLCTINTTLWATADPTTTITQWTQIETTTGNNPALTPSDAMAQSGPIITLLKAGNLFPPLNCAVNHIQFGTKTIPLSSLTIALAYVNTIATTGSPSPATIAAATLYPYNLLFLGATTGPDFVYLGRSLLAEPVADEVLLSFFTPTAVVNGDGTTRTYPALQLDSNGMLLKQTDANFCSDLASKYNTANTAYATEQSLPAPATLTADTVWLGAVCNPDASTAVLGADNPNGHCCGDNLCDTTNVPSGYSTPHGTIPWPAGYGLCATPASCSSTTTCGGTSGSSCCNSTAAAPLACCGLTAPDATTGIAVLACTFNGTSNTGTLAAGTTPSCCTPGTVACCQPTSSFCTENTDCCRGSCDNNSCK